MTNNQDRAAILEAQVNAALAGNALGSLKPVVSTGGGYEAACRRCGKTVWVGENGLLYSLLAERCHGRE